MTDKPNLAAQKAARRAIKGVGPDTDIAGNPLTEEQKATMREVEARWAREDAARAKAARLLDGVPRCDPDWNREMMRVSGNGDYVEYERILAALSAALPADVAGVVEEAAKVLEGVTPGPWRVGPVDDCRVEDALGNEVAQIDGDYNQPDTWPLMEANARFIAWCREGVPALIALATAQAAQIAFTATDGQRLLRKADVMGVCDTPDLCFDSEESVARCGPCAAKIAARDGVTLNKYTHSNPQAMRLRRELTAAETALAAMKKERDKLARQNRRYPGIVADADRQRELAVDLQKTHEANAELARSQRDAAEAALAAERTKVAALNDALRLIELIGYREGEDFGWINAHMRGVATSVLAGQSIEHYWRLFPNHRPLAALSEAEART